MNEKDDREILLYENAKEQIAIVDTMLNIVRHKLEDLRNEMRELEDCTPEEYDVLKKANRLSHELYVDVVKVLQSVRERRRGA